MACSLMGHHAEVQYQCKSGLHYWAALWKGYKCSSDEWQHRRIVQNNSRSKARLSSVSHPLQHFSRTDHVWCPGRTWWEGSIGGRNITNLQFADDIDALAEEEQELEALVESLDKTCTRYKMEISAEKTKLMTNSANGIQKEIKVKGQKLATVTSFKHLKAVVSDDGSKPKVLSRIAQATAALTTLKPIWRDNNISLGSKVKLMRSLVISISLYACESWTLTAELEKRIQAFEMRRYRRLLNISYKDHVTIEEVRRKIQAAIGDWDELLTWSRNKS